MAFDISLRDNGSGSFDIALSSAATYVYTRGDYAALPTDDSDLENTYSAQDYLDAASSDDVRVGQSATAEYAVHTFKNNVGSQTSCHLSWEGQTDQSPTSSAVVLQIYNRNSTTWETIASDTTSAINTDFSLIADIQDLTNYKDGGNMIACRIYQLSL